MYWKDRRARPSPPRLACDQSGCTPPRDTTLDPAVYRNPGPVIASARDAPAEAAFTSGLPPVHLTDLSRRAGPGTLGGYRPRRTEQGFPDRSAAQPAPSWAEHRVQRGSALHGGVTRLTGHHPARPHNSPVRPARAPDHRQPGRVAGPGGRRGRDLPRQPPPGGEGAGGQGGRPGSVRARRPDRRLRRRGTQAHQPPARPAPLRAPRRGGPAAPGRAGPPAHRRGRGRTSPGRPTSNCASSGPPTGARNGYSPGWTPAAGRAGCGA